MNCKFEELDLQPVLILTQAKPILCCMNLCLIFYSDSDSDACICDAHIYDRVFTELDVQWCSLSDCVDTILSLQYSLKHSVIVNMGTSGQYLVGSVPHSDFDHENGNDHIIGDDES